MLCCHVVIIWYLMLNCSCYVKCHSNYFVFIYFFATLLLSFNTIFYIACIYVFHKYFSWLPSVLPTYMVPDIEHAIYIYILFFCSCWLCLQCCKKFQLMSLFIRHHHHHHRRCQFSLLVFIFFVSIAFLPTLTFNEMDDYLFGINLFIILKYKILSIQSCLLASCFWLCFWVISKKFFIFIHLYYIFFLTKTLCT